MPPSNLLPPRRYYFARPPQVTWNNGDAAKYWCDKNIEAVTVAEGVVDLRSGVNHKPSGKATEKGVFQSTLGKWIGTLVFPRFPRSPKFGKDLVFNTWVRFSKNTRPNF